MGLSFNNKINCKIINLPKRVGYSTASNFGIAQSTGNFILWCNNDLIFQINLNLCYLLLSQLTVFCFNR